MGKIVVIAASVGGLEPLRQIVSSLSTPCVASVFIVWHIGSRPSVLPTILSNAGTLPALHPSNGTPIEPGHIYVAPPDHHMLLVPGYIRLSQGAKINYTRPAADALFISAATAYREDVIGIVLTGGDGHGAAGLTMIKWHGGKTFVQDPNEAIEPSMPRAAIAAHHPDAVLSIARIVQRVSELCSESAP
jgi:two-component system chemotaxis response regulator CheB